MTENKYLAYHVKIFKPGADAHDHVLPFGVGRRARVQGRVESRTHLLDTRLQLLALEECYEHRLVDLVALRKCQNIRSWSQHQLVTLFDAIFFYL